MLLTYDQHRKTTMLKAVTSAETKHLEQLIVKQKVRQKLSRFNVKGVSAAPNPSSHSSSRTQATHNRAKGAKSGRINTLPTQRSSEAHMNAMQRFSHSNYLQPAKQKQVDTVTRIPSSFTNLPSTKPTKTSVTVSVDGGIRNVSLAQQAAAGNSISQWPKSVGTGSWSPLQVSVSNEHRHHSVFTLSYLFRALLVPLKTLKNQSCLIILWMRKKTI